jgi:hypothetical protein
VAGVRLGSVPLNRVKLPLTVFRFAFLSEVDSMVFRVYGVYVVLSSLSVVALMA